MAKRKRLTPANTAFLALDPENKTETVRSDRSTPPIAQIAEESSEAAALAIVSEELRSARQEGRMIQRLPLTSLKEDYLIRDRIALDEGELQSLVDSLKERGQQTPIDVTELGGGDYGLISGWRRVAALQRLFKETADDRFSTVLAIIRRPDASSDAYRAMVEENEIRLGLSFYERARIAAKATEQGVFATQQDAVQTLYAAASRAKRSKIYSFIEIYHALDAHLHYPGAISERLGLLISKAITTDEHFSRRLKDHLRKTDVKSPKEELAILERAVSRSQSKQSSESPASESKTSGQAIRIEARFEKDDPHITIRGEGVDKAFLARLKKWATAQSK